MKTSKFKRNILYIAFTFFSREVSVLHEVARRESDLESPHA